MIFSTKEKQAGQAETEQGAFRCILDAEFTGPFL